MLMSFLAWLFGKKQPTTATGTVDRESPASTHAPGAPTNGLDRPTAPRSEAENLKRWRESGQARAWVEARKGRWNHADWVTLLAELERSPFWPMHPQAVGQVLEELK